MTRRAPNDKGEPSAAPVKEVRRDSKGFEDFDDYFESDGNDTTINTVAGEKTNDSVEEEDSTATPEEATEEQFTSVPAPTETMPEEILDGNKEEEVNYCTTVNDTRANFKVVDRICMRFIIERGLCFTVIYNQ